MSQEIPPESQEPTPEREMSAEEFEEMIAQIPALEEMVLDRQAKLMN